LFSFYSSNGSANVLSHFSKISIFQLSGFLASALVHFVTSGGSNLLVGDVRHACV
jgi:hypothetical protein